MAQTVSLSEKVNALAAKDWRKVAPPALPSGEPRFWNFQSSPPLPCAWPAQGSGKICYYLYAQATDPRLADGVRVAAPWAKAVADLRLPSPDPRIELLGMRLEELGIQGYRPLSGGELAIVKTGDAAKRGLEAWVAGRPGLSPGSLAEIKTYYCQWKRNNGVIAAALAPQQAEFFAWLACGD